MAVVCLLAAPLTAGAQLVAAKDALTGYGHHHLNVSDVAAHKRFWIDALGGRALKIGGSPAEVSGVGNDANDFQSLVAADLDTLAYRTGAAEIASRQRIVDDDGSR